MSLSVHTRVGVEFFTDSDNGFSGRIDESDLPFLLTSASVKKAFGNASGEFTLSFKPTDPYEDLRDLWKEPEDVWVKIVFIVNGFVYESMFGLVDNVREETIREDQGARPQTFEVVGRDFGKVLETTELFINIFERDGALTAIIPMYDSLQQNLQGAPHDFILALMEAWVGNNGLSDAQWKLPSNLYGGISFFDTVNLSTVSRKTKGHMQDPTILQPDQNRRKLWDAMQEYSNGVLNELFFDLGPNPAQLGGFHKHPVHQGEFLSPIYPTSVQNLAPCLYLRERPFPEKGDRSRWDALPTFDLKRGDIQKRHISKGGAQARFNFWMLEGQSLQAKGIEQFALVQERAENGKPGGFPIYDVESIRKHGLRRFHQGTRFIPLVDEEVGPKAYIELTKWLQKVHDWYVPGPRHQSGSITTTYAMPWVRIGQRVREFLNNGRRVIFYVEGVEHRYNYPNNGMSSFQLTRGEFEDEDLLQEIYDEINQESVSVGGFSTGSPVSGDSQQSDTAMNHDTLLEDPEDLS